MRLEEGRIVIEYTDLLLTVSQYVRKYKFHNRNNMPLSVHIEIPLEACDVTNPLESCAISFEQVEGDPPAEWFRRGIKSAEHAAPTQVPHEETPPMPKIHEDEMYKITADRDAKIARHDEDSLKLPKKQEPTETISGDITEDTTLSTDPDAGLAIQEVDPDDFKPRHEAADNSGHERTSELDRAAEAVDTADSPTTEPDGDE